ncbi:hypothetical protein TRFO_22730 [Tritrichomonas foetus]|uniref:Uncharacterized protein n=1 Tax=Tritrichomonas foetus TaxID=1144522 RepID=A0A1J4KB57_9EUKA|nr:hypothetical protein TRFO_22730 [Tritrichomonas foetus]|eukprot:OHT08649.1 hypothetical protein TRFO_22730 [Tritrichomonas foetus]
MMKFHITCQKKFNCFMANAAYCCLPGNIYTLIKSSKCIVSFHKDEKAVDIINSETKEKIITLLFGPQENNSEMVFVTGTSIEYNLPINQVMNIDGKSLTNVKVRAKSSRLKPKEKIVLSDIPCEFATPISTVDNLSDDVIMREHIRGTIEFIRNSFSEEEHQRNALSDLITSLKIYKNREKINPYMEELKNARKTKSIPDMIRILTSIALDL